MNTTTPTFDEVKTSRDENARHRGPRGQPDASDAATRQPARARLDGRAQLILALEERFGVTVDDDEVTGELFETLGTLAAFIERKLN